MTDDIVKRLRAVDHSSAEDCFFRSPMFETAAAEITSLREQLFLKTTECSMLHDEVALADDYARLRSALEAAHYWLTEEATSSHPGQTSPDEILRVIEAALAGRAGP